MTDLQDRLKEFLDYLNIPMQTFERKSGIGQGLGSRLSNKSYATTFKRIGNAYPQLNIDWLKTGEGEMLNPQPQEHYEVGVGIGQQKGGKSDFKIEIKESDDAITAAVKDDERKICDLEREIEHLGKLLAEKDSRIAELQASVDRLTKMNDYLMGQK